MRNRQLPALVLLGLTILILTQLAGATENGGTPYPNGAETVLPAVAPTPKMLLLQDFQMFYSANRFNDSRGRNSIPNFRVTVFAQAYKFKYNWGVKFLGGYVYSAVSPVLTYQQLEAAGAQQTKFNMANNDIEPVFINYTKGSLHWQYGLDIWTPGPTYKASDMVNIGQHYWEFEPVYAITWLPNKGKTELSSRIHYGTDTTNGDTHYHSGDYFNAEFNACRTLKKNVTLGFNGYWMRQVRDDTIHGQRVGDGNQTKDLGLGPELRAPVGKSAVIAFKYFRDTHAQNHAVGNAFWFELGVPVFKGEQR